MERILRGDRERAGEERAKRGQERKREEENWREKRKAK